MLFCVTINGLQDISHGAGELCRETRAGGNLFFEKGEYFLVTSPKVKRKLKKSSIRQ